MDKLQKLLQDVFKGRNNSAAIIKVWSKCGACQSYTASLQDKRKTEPDMIPLVYVQVETTDDACKVIRDFASTRNRQEQSVLHNVCDTLRRSAYVPLTVHLVRENNVLHAESWTGSERPSKPDVH